MSQETKVGMFLLCAIGAILASILLLGNVDLFARRTAYYVDFDDVQALPPKAAVKISGVEIGKVANVDLIEGRARVTIGVRKGITLYQNARAKIGSTGIIGTRFVELIPGTPSAGELSPKSVIQGMKGGSLEDMVSNLGSIFDDDEKYGNAMQNLKATIANIRRVSESLNVALGQHPKELEEVVLNVRKFTADLAEISTQRKEDFKEAIAKFRDVGVKLDSILSKIDNGEGAIGALVSDKKTESDVKEAVASIKETAASAKKVLGRFTMINTYWNYRLRYDFRDDEARSDVAINFEPRGGKFYSFGATNIGEVPHDEKHTQYERKNRITAVMGQWFGPVGGYAGAIRSSGGVGVMAKPLWKVPKYKDRLVFSAEASEFNRDRTINGTRFQKTWVAAGMNYAVTRWWWVGVRAEDILERSAFMGYTNIVLRDEDLAYLLGFASVAR
jgi:phospholipid/cholesterol/gamma-HCH transport system substrate-binding protein